MNGKLLTPAEKTVCRMFNLSEEDFRAQRAKGLDFTFEGAFSGRRINLGRQPGAARGTPGRPGCQEAIPRSASDPLLRPDHAEHLVAQGGHGRLVVRLHVEAQ